MAASPIDKIVSLLASDSQEKRLAAAIVLGELRAKGPEVVKALAACLLDGGPPLQCRCLEALAAIGARKAVPQILPLTAVRDATVREAAVAALASVGEEVVPLLEGKASGASPEQRRALDEVLARVGGKEAFTALIASLDGADEQAANAAAVAMRARVKDADGNQRRSYLAQLGDVLERQKKKKPAEQSPAALKAALKMLGYLEDARAAELLLDFTGPKFAASIRQEALIALRFTFKTERPEAKIVNALVAAASDADRALAQAALITLAGIPLPARAAERLEPLLAHPDLERARFVIDMLAHRQTEEATLQLVEVLGSLELRRAELAARALVGRKEAAHPLTDLLLATRDVARARLVARVMDGLVGELKPASHRKLLETSMTRLEASDMTWQPLFEVAHLADPIAAGNAMRELHAKVAKRKPDLALDVLRQLCRTDQATREDRFALAVKLLAASPQDTSPGSRNADESLGILSRLLRERFDVAGALLASKTLELEPLYYAGFHFVEEGHPTGEDLLRAVVERAGRKKLGTMAKNKLALAERRG
ncbi:MAG: HEAT repeat domain-containing protein [Deltaproteobacteria bacterium]|nr:HEAT repeat domain-containing protein [Deltaproteobacteria bacterium]